MQLAKGRQYEGLTKAGIDALVVIQLMQVLCLGAEIVILFLSSRGPCTAAAQGKGVLRCDISVP